MKNKYLFKKRCFQKVAIYALFLFNSLLFFGQAKECTFTGTVSDAKTKQSLPGVGISIDNKQYGYTDFDGKFKIKTSLPTGSHTVSTSFIGFKNKKEIINTVDNSSIIVNFNLYEDIQSLDEVVVLGSSLKASKKELGNAITSIKADALTRTEVSGLSSALQGKIAGAQISQNSGDPSGGFSIKLRGTSSILGSSDPLYVVDGVILNNATTNVTNLNISTNSNMQIGQNRTADINLNDIESVEVLNGGAAAAIYGSRAANGVILITTKKGKLGEAKFTFSTSVTANSLRKRLNTNLINKQFNTSAAALFPISTVPAASSTTVALVGNNGTGIILPSDTRYFDTKQIDVSRYDYQDDIFNTGFGSDTYLSATGGNEKTKYFGSIGYMKNEGIIKNSDFSRLGAKIRIQNDFNSKISASFGLNYVYSFSNEKPDGNVFYSPLNAVTISNNIYNINQRDANGDLQSVDPNRVNPLSIIQTFNITQKTDRIISDLQINYKPFKNLTADLIIGVDNYNQKGTVFIPRFPYAPVNPLYFNDGYVSEASNRVVQVNNDLNLRYLYIINKKLESTTTAGLNVQLYRDNFFAVAGRDLKPFIETINAFNTPLSGSPSASQANYNLWGYFLQETIGFDKKLYLTFAGRIDASTIFASDKRSQFYPKVSASYVLSEESFMKDLAFSTIRFRGSWGESGSLTAIGPYARFSNYTSGNLVGNTTFTLQGLRRGNLDLKPEKSSTYEVGADIGLIKNRINLSFSYYNADIKDLLVPVQTAGSTGATSVIKNIGLMNNKGFEVSFKADVIKTQNFNLDMYVNYSRNRNIVTGLAQKRFQLDSNESGAPVFAEEGKPLGIFYGTYFARNPDGSLLLTTSGYPQAERGNIVTGEIGRFNDPLNPSNPMNGQPLGSTLNKEIGNPNPDYIISFGLNMNIKKFGISVLFDGVQGVSVFDADYRTRQGTGSGELVAQELSGQLPRGYIASIYPVQEFRVVDGSYIKLRELSFNYSFGKINHLFNDLTINLSGRNLYSWDKFPSYDPETNSGGQSSVAKYNFGAIPIPRSFSLAFKFQF